MPDISNEGYFECENTHPYMNRRLRLRDGGQLLSLLITNEIEEGSVS